MTAFEVFDELVAVGQAGKAVGALLLEELLADDDLGDVLGDADVFDDFAILIEQGDDGRLEIVGVPFLAAVLDDAAPDLLVREGAPYLFIDRPRHVGMVQEAVRVADELFGPIAADALEEGIDVGDAPLEVGARDDGALIEGVAVLFEKGEGVGELLGGDVAQAGEGAQREIGFGQMARQGDGARPDRVRLGEHHQGTGHVEQAVVAGKVEEFAVGEESRRRRQGSEGGEFERGVFPQVEPAAEAGEHIDGFGGHAAAKLLGGGVGALEEGEDVADAEAHRLFGAQGSTEAQGAILAQPYGQTGDVEAALTGDEGKRGQ